MSYFSNNIQFLRKKSGLTPDELSSKIDVPVDTINMLEKSKLEPSVRLLIKYSGFFNYSIDHLVRKDIAENMKIAQKFDFKLLILDVDGVMTDGGMYYTESGDEFKKFNAKDGLALLRLSEANKKTGIISSGHNVKIIETRAKHLGISFVHVGTWDKPEILKKWCKDLDINLSQVAFIADDLNDLPLIEKVGLSACPSDAAEKVKSAVNVILSKKGGEGCVREFVEEYLIDIN
ncbi:MAG: helix-turn-helix domain-containing protein [Bacteroidota bacterium]